MAFIQFLMGNPVVAFMVLLVSLVTVVPLCAASYRRRHPKPAVDGENLARGDMKEPPVRFLGTQMDVAILIFGVLLLVAIVVPMIASKM
jgi:hypothetical protein